MPEASPERRAGQERTASRSQAETLADVERAIAALEAQREVLGDDVVETALGPLRARRTTLRGAAAGERRRLVTVLFADLEGFTALSGRLDPEEVRDIVTRCFSRWQRAIEEQGGVVEKYIGDAVMAVFGLQVSAEDDAARAVRAGRAMVAALAEVADETERRHGARLHMRVGVDTGDVVVSTLGERGEDFVAVGPTVNRASRLQAHAPRDAVLVSAETRRQVRGRFGLQERPGLVLKGLAEPVTAYVVTAERPPGFELGAGAGVGGVETATVGRESELQELRDHLAEVVEESRWRITTITGDAGVGKSRLLAELDVWLAERSERVWWFRGRASSSGRDRPHAMLRDAVATRFRIAPTDPPRTVAERCEQGYVLAFGPSPRARRESLLVARWLGFEVPDDPSAALPREPQRLREEATGLLAGYLARLAERQPVVLILEDLHWADDASLNWLEDAHALLADRPVWVVATARPTFADRRPHWGEGLEHHAALALGPLSRRECRQLTGQLLQRVADVPTELVDVVVDGAEGNPYYVEELVTWLVDRGVVTEGEDGWWVRADRIGRVDVPPTLTGLLQARLDALRGRERSVLQRASVVGRVFWDSAVMDLADGPEDSPVPETLEHLRARELVLRRATSAFGSAGEFLFKHAMLRDVTYEGMLRSHRRVFHARAAEWLVAVTAEHGRTEEFAGLVAEHAEAAGDPSAAGWYLRAGRRAASVFANEEAVRLLERGLAIEPGPSIAFDLLAEHETVCHRLADRERQSADLAAMAALLDDVGPERAVRHHLARARQAFDVSDYDEAVTWAERARAEADALGATQAGARARLMAGKAHTWAGDTAAAEASLEASLARARSDGPAEVEGESLRYLGMLAGNRSDYETSIAHLHAARAVFEADGDPEGVGSSLVQLSATYYNLGRLADARRHLEDARPVFAHSGNRYAEAIVLGNLGVIAAAQGELARALGWLGDAIPGMRAIGDREGAGVNLSNYADVERQLGRNTAAAAHAEEAVALCVDVGNDILASAALTSQARALSALGEHEAAVATARDAAAAGERGASRREAAVSAAGLGHVLLAAGAPAAVVEAVEVFAGAQAVLDELGVTGAALEALAGYAGARLACGEVAAAVEVVERLLPAVGVVGDDPAGLEGAQPEVVLPPCLAVLEAAGDARAGAVRARAAELVAARAELVGPELAAEYLAVPAVAALR